MSSVEKPGQAERHSSAEKVSTLGGFVAGALAACGAVTFTNPIELIKTRMQLQGELEKSASKSSKLYKNPVQAFWYVYRHEGVRGLQKGLLCGYYYQIGLNGCRIGLYEPSRYWLTQVFDPKSINHGERVPQSVPVNVTAGFISGAAGAVVASPFFLIKTRMQSYSGLKAGGEGPGVAHPHVGQQTYYKNAWDGILRIYSSEGIRGLFRGVDAAVLRTGAGSAAQLPVYYFTKHTLEDYNIVAENSTALHFISSAMAGLGVAVVMNPWDVVLTRVYNQKGNLYSGPVDCFLKSVRAEGFGALYKGFWAQLFRVWPHSVLTLMFMEHSMKFIEKIELRFRH